jgi:hypothetical protein
VSSFAFPEEAYRISIGKANASSPEAKQSDFEEKADPAKVSRVPAFKLTYSIAR